MTEKKQINNQGFTEEDRKLLKKLRSKASPKKEIGMWTDLPSAMEEYPEDVIDNGDRAQVGQTYITYSDKSRKVHFNPAIRKKMMTLPWYVEEEDQEVDYEDSKGTIKTVHGIEVWAVLQPIPIKQIPSVEVDISRQLSKNCEIPTVERRERHDKEVKAWREKPMKDRIDTSITSLPILPNGKYWSDRWLPKIKEDNGKWRPASANDCASWYTISEDKRRVDYLERVIPDE